MIPSPMAHRLTPGWTDPGHGSQRGRGFARDLVLLFKSPFVTVTLSGAERAAELFRYYTSRHPRFLLIQNKKWGVALLSLPATFEDYLGEPSRLLVRRKRKRCLSLGYSFAELDPTVHLEEILRINTSRPHRQGEDMHPQYVDPELVRQFFRAKQKTYGVFDSAGTLRAYACAPVYGELFELTRLLGDGDHLDRGVMYLLLSEVIREMIRARTEHGVPRWGMYDMYFGAQPGLRYFKDRLGFAPHNVKWLWRP